MIAGIDPKGGAITAVLIIDVVKGMEGAVSLRTENANIGARDVMTADKKLDLFSIFP